MTNWIRSWKADPNRKWTERKWKEARRRRDVVRFEDVMERANEDNTNTWA